MKSTAQVASQAAAASTDLKLPALEVVSVRPNRSPGSVGVSAGGDGVYIKNIPLRRIVSLAYDFKLRDLVSGLPDWADSEHFDITGKVASQTLTHSPNSASTAAFFCFSQCSKIASG